MPRQHWKRALTATLASIATVSSLASPLATAQEGSIINVPAGLRDTTVRDAGPIQHLPFAHFAIPFDVDTAGRAPSEVHLWVSPDGGQSWLKYGSSTPDKRSFEFRAAAEGEYLFAVQTRDSQGESSLAAAPLMRVVVDTSKPRLQLQADVTASGRLWVDYQVNEKYLAEDSVRLAYSLDGSGVWQDVPTGILENVGSDWGGHCEIEMPNAREIDFKLTASDLAQNNSEARTRFSAPRTASAAPGLQLASQRGDQQISPQQQGDRRPVDMLSADQRLKDAKASDPWRREPKRSEPNVLVIGAPTSTFAQTHIISDATGPSTRKSQALPEANPKSEALAATAGAVPWNPGNPQSKTLPADNGSSPSAMPQTIDLSSRRTSGGWTSLPPAQATARTVSTQPESQGSLKLETSAPASARDLDSQSSRTANSPSAPSAPGVMAAPRVPYEELPRPVAIEEKPTYPTATLNAASPGSSLDMAEPRSVMKPMDLAPPQSSVGKSVDPKSLESNSAPNQSPENKSLLVESLAPAPARSAIADNGSSVAAPPASSIADAFHSRSRSFSLDYAIDSLRGMAVSDVELWGTEDRGATWQKWGSDPDRQSPFDVQVSNDGMFGFRMVIIGANGLVSNRPHDRDPADMWINVDTQSPRVKITHALYGEGADAGKLVIDYVCDDDNLHDRPITLSYCERPTGPWVTIEGGLGNTGTYLWKADSGLPQQVYVRVQAVDRAGNTIEHCLDLPVNLRGLAPRGRIQGFRPIDAK